MKKRVKILRIRCSSGTIRRFKVAAVDFDTYEDTLMSMMDRHEAAIKVDKEEAKARGAI